jgi:hypothetical protein
MPFTLVSDYSIAFAINTIYAPDLHAMEAPYWFLSALRYVGTSIPFLEADQPVNYAIRNVQFSGNTSHSLALHSLSSNVCLRVLAPVDALTPWLSSDQVELARLSNLDQIDIDPKHATPPPVEIFGPEPQHNWCFYYEKADLAGQQKQWNMVISLADEANSEGFNPNNGMELLPFINAYGQVGQWDKAVELTQQASNMTHELEPELCSMWATLKGNQSMSTAGLAALTKVNQLYGCNLE